MARHIGGSIVSGDEHARPSSLSAPTSNSGCQTHPIEFTIRAADKSVPGLFCSRSKLLWAA